MFNWTSYLILSSQIVVLFWLATPCALRMVYRGFVHRHREYFAAHPEFARAHPVPVFSVRLAWVAGAVLLSALGYVRAARGPDAVFVYGFVAPLLAHVLLVFGYGAVEYLRLFRDLPLPVKRRASLQPRNLRHYLHPGWVALPYALIGAVALLYLAGFASGQIGTPLFTARMVGLLSGTAIGSVCLVRGMRRKDQPIDAALGPGYRKFYVVAVVALLGLLGLVGAWRAAQDFLRVLQFSDAVIMLMLSVLYQLVLLILVTHPVARRLAAEPAPAN